MLSVLIPVYNYDIKALVNLVHKQLMASEIIFEILCLDDNSNTNTSVLNAEIGQLQNTSYQISKVNTGRVATRQTLAEQAKYDWLLFLDADVMPKLDEFISNYIAFLSSEYDAIYGGFAYQPEQPKNEFMLRWTYGSSNEQVQASLRNKTPYKIVISANFMIKKSVFLKLNSKITQRGYGYDNFFGALLKSGQYNVFHIDNEVYHLGLEPNERYLHKIEQSVVTLLKLDSNDHIQHTENSLYNSYKLLKKLKLNYVFSLIYTSFKKQFRKNLLSNKPNIRLLQFYKLSYICYLELNS
ncbi:glycosyltransferase family 2 protein [Psychroserpens damuponensis]|uniref:glycosyltransferase family 2 protein n=1 Tax=Psychroserpens damuponensis TaxID=943936 RepID=UPI0005900B33|nr:glycosyltransferase family 2 protein [Psychroserpens damuponensis]